LRQQNTVDDAAGRYAKLTPSTIVSGAPVPTYPSQPPNSPFAADPVGVEPPLGYEIDALPSDLGGASSVVATPSTNDDASSDLAGDATGGHSPSSPPSWDPPARSSSMGGSPSTASPWAVSDPPVRSGKRGWFFISPTKQHGRWAFFITG
jgi:hypothetical protein